jgi:hypothetical protein
MFGVEDRHAEVRVRLTVEGALNRNRYLNNYYLRSGLGRDTQYTICELYTSLCGAYDYQNTPDDLTRIYNGDVYNTRVDGAYCGIFQVRQYTVINEKMERMCKTASCIALKDNETTNLSLDSCSNLPTW